MTDNPTTAEDGVFEIALVMAGAVSAGAYTAGAVDYLTEKLQAFYAWKASEDSAAPKHDVRIRVLSGASAGGICAAVTAAQAVGSQQNGGGHSVLYNLWVKGVDIVPMLALDDLESKDASVESLLNTSVIDDLSEKAIDLDPKGGAPEFLSKNLEIILSLANMRGVPYSLSAQGSGAAFGHHMSLHADAVYFSFKPGGRGRFLDPLSIGLADPGWQELSSAARATSAFPIGLKARVLNRPAKDYNQRLWPVPQSAPPPCVVGQPIPPDWPSGDDVTYRALYVDGGLMNNEPLELARTAMAGIGGRNPRGPREAFRATLMIDPFPDTIELDPNYQPKATIIDVLKSMFSALKLQARFKPDELSLALDGASFSRFLLAPKRVEASDVITLPALQSAILGAFGGFLSEAFREHDYQLGRRNCERFLKRHFYLAADNPVFKGWMPGAPYLADRPDGMGAAMPSLPILPIENMLNEECPLPDRISGQAAVNVSALASKVEERIKRVLKRLLRNDLGICKPVRFAIMRFLPGYLLKKVKRMIETELARLD